MPSDPRFKHFAWDRALLKGDDPGLEFRGYSLDIAGRQPRESTVFDQPRGLRPQLILVGGAEGIGKSAVCERAAKRYRTSGRTVLQVHLGRGALEPTAVSELAKGRDPVLVLDALDERVISIGQARTDLVLQLRDCASHRIDVVIFSRPAALSGWFVEELRGIDGFEVETYRLAPLTHEDVQVAARHVGVDGDAFLRAVDARNVGPLATRPLTLLPLLEGFPQVGIPRTRREAFEEACKRLVTEGDPRRRDERSPTSPAILLQIAGFLAIVTTIRGAAVVIDADALIEGAVTLGELGEWHEAGPIGSVAVDRGVLLEVLDTGLFTPVTHDRWAWAHSSFREFLAARYLVMHTHLSEPSILRLAEAPGHPDRRFAPSIVPALAWACAFRSELVTPVLARDPFVLLEGDPASLSESMRATVVDRVLEAFDRGRYVDFQPREDRLAGFTGAGVLARLRPWITGERGGWFARRLAIRIAFAGPVAGATPVLLKRALDRKELPDLRSWAALHVLRHGTPAERCRLRPIAVRADPAGGRELRGIALQAVYPDFLDTDSVLRIIGAGDVDEGTLDVYRQFVQEHFPRRLPREDVAGALRWVARHGRMMRDEAPRALDAVLWRAWDLSHFDDVLTALVAVLWRLIPATHGSLLRLGLTDRSDPVATDHFRRRRVVQALIATMPRKIRHPAFELGRFISREDFAWYVQQAEAAPLAVGRRWAALARAAHDDGDQAQSDVVLRVCGLPRFREAFRAWVDGVPVDEDSIRSAAREEARRLSQEEGERLAAQGIAAPEAMDLLATSLNTDDTDWPGVHAKLHLFTARRRLREWRWDVTDTPGWRSADMATRERIVACARRWLTLGPPVSPGADDVRFVAYAAFRLLDASSPVPDALHRRWVELWSDPRTLVEVDGDVGTKLLARAYLAAPKLLLTALMGRLLDADPFVVLKRLAAIWDVRVDRALHDARARAAWPRDVIVQVLEVGLERGSVRARRVAQDEFAKWSSDPAAYADASRLAATWITHDALAWTVVWPGLKASRPLLRSFVQHAAHLHPMRTSSPLGQLAPAALATLLEAVTAEFPVERARGRSTRRTREVEERDEIASWRRTIVEALVGHGTRESVEELRALVERTDEDLWRWDLERADARWRMAAFDKHRPAVADVRGALAGAHLVRSDAQLRDAILEALTEMQVELTVSTTPQVRFLWNEGSQPTPKDESALSDWIKVNLERRLRPRKVVVNREVEVRHGNQTDLHVQAVLDEADRTAVLEVPIEVKCRWWTESEFEDAVREQLVGQYLSREHPVGVFVVGWHHRASYRPHRGPGWSVVQAGRGIDGIVKRATPKGFDVVGYVLDLGLPVNEWRRRPKRRRTRGR